MERIYTDVIFFNRRRFAIVGEAYTSADTWAIIAFFFTSYEEVLYRYEAASSPGQLARGKISDITGQNLFESSVLQVKVYFWVFVFSLPPTH